MTISGDITLFHDALVLCAQHMLGSRKDAEDVVQEVYIKVMARPELDFADPRALKSYLFRAVRNMTLDRLKRKDALHRTVDIIDREVMEEAFVEFDEQLIQRIGARMAALPARQRHVIQLIFVSGLRYKEAAEEMGITENTVKTLLRNGLKSLRSHFGGRVVIYLLFV